MLAICLALIDDEQDKISFEQLVKKYEKKLYAVAFSVLKKHELAEEAVWDAFYRIADNYNTVKNLEGRSLEAYLIITVKNCSLRIYSKEKKYSENLNLDKINEPADFSDMEKYSLEEVTQAIKDLEPKYQSVITYIYYYGHSALQTAKIMGISKSAVYKYLNKAKKILSERLG